LKYLRRIGTTETFIDFTRSRRASRVTKEEKLVAGFSGLTVVVGCCF
jgi:hypothetical protein